MTLYSMKNGSMAAQGAGLQERKPARKGFGTIGTGALVAAALAAAISFPLRDRDRVMAREQPPASQLPKPRWIDIPKPYQLYTFETPEFARLTHAHEARRLAAGPGRWDSLTLGNFTGAGPWLHFDITRFGRAGQPEPGFFIELARHAAEAGLAVSRSDAPARIASRFGGMDYAAVVLERGMLQARCQAFRLGELGPDLSIAGIYCPAPGKPQEAGNLVCMLDRLSLAGGGEDAALRQIFVAAELKREAFCFGSRYIPQKTASAVPPPLGNFKK